MSDYEKLFRVHRTDSSIEDDGCRLKGLELLGYAQPIGDKLQLSTQLRYYREPDRYPLDLNCGPDLGAALHKSFNPEMRLEHYQLALVRQYGSRTRALLRSVDFFTHGAALQSVMLTPYRDNLSWQLLATRYKNRIYLNLRREEQHKSESNVTMTNSAVATYDGKLMQHCFVEAPGEKAQPERSLEDSPPLFGIFRGELRHINLLWAAELSGLLNEERLKQLDLCTTLESARHTITRAMRTELNWRTNEKMLEWALQGLLCNADRLSVGFYNRVGLVHYKMMHLSPQEMIERQFWKLHCCTGFLYKLLDRIEDLMGNEVCPYTAWEFTYSAKDATVRYRRHRPKSEFSFISDKMVACIDSVYN